MPEYQAALAEIDAINSGRPEFGDDGTGAPASPLLPLGGIPAAIFWRQLAGCLSGNALQAAET